MSDWQMRSIGSLCDIVKGETGLASATPGEYPLVTTGVERKTTNTWQFDTEAVCIPLVSSTGHGKKTLNYVHYQAGKFALGTILAAVIPKDKNILSASYMHRYLQFYKDKKIVPLMRGAANVSLAVRDIAKIEIPVPPIEKQRSLIQLFNRLYDFDNAFGDEAATQSASIAKLRQAVLQEAIEGKLTADWRKSNPVRKGDVEYDAVALLAKIKTEKQKLVAEGKIRKEKPFVPIKKEDVPFTVPEGWVWAQLREMAESLSTGPFGSMLHKSDYIPDGIPLVNPINMIKEGILANSKMMVSESTAKRLSHYLLKENDILIARRGNLSKCAIITKEQEHWLCGTGSFFMRILLVNINFFVLLYRSKYFQDYLLHGSIGQTMDNLNQKLLAKALIPLPPLSEQRAIALRIEKIFTIIDDLKVQEKENRGQAGRLLQAVLGEAFEGG
jgi:type I restriction enzyme S subunit